MSNIIFEIDNHGLEVSENWPDELRIIHTPDKTTYEEGEQIDLTGIVVQAYKNGVVWENEDGTYVDGYIPINELSAHLDQNLGLFYSEIADCYIKCYPVSNGFYARRESGGNDYYRDCYLQSSESTVYAVKLHDLCGNGPEDKTTYDPYSWLFSDKPFTICYKYIPRREGVPEWVPQPEHPEYETYIVGNPPIDSYRVWLDGLYLYGGSNKGHGDFFQQFTEYNTLWTKTNPSMYSMYYLWCIINDGKQCKPISSRYSQDFFVGALQKLVLAQAMDTPTNRVIVSWERSYSVSFIDRNNSVLKEESVLFGKNATPPEAVPDIDGWSFTHWDKPYTNIQENTIIKAVYKKLCSVSFVSFDGDILKTDNVWNGGSAIPPENVPPREGWAFAGWDRPYDNIQDDTEIHAVYTQDYNVVQFVAWNGDVLKTENVASGFSAHPPQDAPAREGWVFTGWDKPYDNIQEDTVIHATYGHDQYFTVTFRGYDGKVLKKELAYRGSNATPPGRVPRRPGYHFAGWSGSYKNIQGDTTLWALYEPGEDGDKPKRIKIEFDTQLTPLQPRMLLATRSGSILGELPINHVHFTDDLGSGSEIAFQVYKERCLDENDEINEKFWRKIESMRLGYCPEFDEWYELDVEFTDSSEKVKSVTAVSLGEAELSQIRVYNIEINSDVDIARDDYAPTTLYNRVDKSCSLIDRLLYKAPHYTVKHVDDSIADLQRTFQFNDRSVYDCFQDIGKEIGCLFRVECRKEDDQNIVREISVYDLWCQCLNCGARGEFTEKCNKCGSTDIKPGYGEDTTIYVDKDNLADKVVFSTDIDSIKNCFRLSAGDDLMTSVIVSCNPNGSQYMWYIPEYMQEDMSDKLRERLNEYNRLFDYYQKEYRLAATPMIPDEF